ncbi:hypothetical protein UFOVP27_98 [uncultured Caudovirales phage]|uniref:Uncharacterized protein n=1 Tax=uncultured Caudovirales phage TaxID=2100421 RepID=A0A6J5KLZ7_9CAUD|nr:hypothetical protein UFOVP27_98 [uncultured Caudovirales phage]
MRGDNREGRFSIPYERGSNVSGTSVELVKTVGTQVDWWIYDQSSSVIDPIYDVASDSIGGGRKWKTPFTIPVVNAHLEQGITVQSDRGFYNTDQLTIVINVDVIENHINFYGANASNIRELSTVEINPDVYLRDRIVFRHEVFSPVKVLPQGIIKDKYTLLQVTCEQVNAEELVNDSQFQHFANYSAFDPTTL